MYSAHSSAQHHGREARQQELGAAAGHMASAVKRKRVTDVLMGPAFSYLWVLKGSDTEPLVCCDAPIGSLPV